MRRMCVRVAVLSALVIGSGLLYVGPCPAAVPGRISYQGKLTDASGRLVTDGSYDLVFTLFDDPSAGDEKWSEPHDNVRVTNGLFSALLGAVSDMTPVFRQNDALYLEIAVEGEALSPRQQVLSAGYALRADRADEADGVKDGAITLSKLDTSTIPGLDSNGYSLQRLPTVSSISPDTKVTGYSSFTATITGSGFPIVSQAKIGPVELTNENVSSSTSMTADVPAGLTAGSHDVSVSNTNFDWGTGTDLFTVNTPTPTSTPTATPTSTPTAVQASCKAIKDAGGSSGDGTYRIDPDGAGGADPFDAYCDMTSDGGGWTLVARVAQIVTYCSLCTHSAVGELSSPTQDTEAKLADDVINLLGAHRSGGLFRLTCGGHTDYWDGDEKLWNAQDGAGTDLHRCKDTYETADWCTNPVANDPDRTGVDGYPSCAEQMVFQSRTQPGCNAGHVYPGDQWRNKGVVFVR